MVIDVHLATVSSDCRTIDSYSGADKQLEHFESLKKRILIIFIIVRDVWMHHAWTQPGLFI